MSDGRSSAAFEERQYFARCRRFKEHFLPFNNPRRFEHERELEYRATHNGKKPPKPRVLKVPANRLSAAQVERLSILAEECGETIQIIGKILRHGYASSHPESCYDNRVQLNRELGDVHAAMEFLAFHGEISRDTIKRARTEKLERFLSGQYLHHQQDVKEKIRL